MRVIFAALAAIAFLLTPALARHVDIEDCIKVNGKWYCPLEQCHYTKPKKPFKFIIEGNGSDGGGKVVIVDPDDPVDPVDPKKDHDDNGHGNDPGKVDPSNPGKSKD